MKYLKTYSREQSNLCNESIKHFLKPKNIDDVIKSLNLIDDDYEKVETMLNYKMIDIVPEEFNNLFNSLDLDTKLSLIIDYGYEEYFGKNYIFNLINDSELNLDDKLYIIFNQIKELSDILTNVDIKKLFNKENNSENKIDAIESYGLIDIFDKNEIKNIIFDIKNNFTKLDCIYVYDLQEYFTKKEVLNIFNKLTDIEKRLIISHDDLYDILPEDIIKKYED